MRSILAVDARYERGLVLGDLKRWSDAVTAWQELAAMPMAKNLADRIAYELAWAQRESGNVDASNQEFERIARDFPQSPIAADAFFQLGERDYAASKFAEAASWYEKSLVPAQPPCSEKRALLQAWVCSIPVEGFHAFARDLPTASE
jgi:tetratricopeptide (TPR) repeat protein